MISQRDSFFNRLYDLAKDNPDIYLVSADMGAPSLDRFRKNLPNQYIDAGIAEQSAILLACGLAKMGKKVFVYAISPFLAYRTLEMIRVDVAGMCLPVTLVGIGAGMGYDDSGPTHHTTEDIAMLRTLPNLRIHNISDPVMAEAFAEISVGLDYPNYIRLDRQANDELCHSEGVIGLGAEMAVFSTHSRNVIIATGNMVHRAVEVADELRCAVVDVYEFPLTERAVSFLNNIEWDKIITLEEHVLPGGLGSAVLEVLNDNGINIPVLRIGLDFSKGFCYTYGGREELQKAYGLDKDSIVKRIKEFI